MRTDYSMTSKEAFGEPYKSREDETRKEIENNYCLDYLTAQIALSLGRIADMLTELRGYIVRYDEEREEE